MTMFSKRATALPSFGEQEGRVAGQQQPFDLDRIGIYRSTSGASEHQAPSDVEKLQQLSVRRRLRRGGGRPSSTSFTVAIKQVQLINGSSL